MAKSYFRFDCRGLLVRRKRWRRFNSGGCGCCYCFFVYKLFFIVMLWVCFVYFVDCRMIFELELLQNLRRIEYVKSDAARAKNKSINIIIEDTGVICIAKATQHFLQCSASKIFYRIFSPIFSLWFISPKNLAFLPNSDWAVYESSSMIYQVSYSWLFRKHFLALKKTHLAFVITIILSFKRFFFIKNLFS